MNTLVVLLLTSCAPAQYPTMQSSSSVPMGSYSSGDAGWSGQSQESRPRFFSRIRGYFRRQGGDQQMPDQYSGSGAGAGSYSQFGGSSGMPSGSYAGSPSMGSPSMGGSYITSPGSMNGSFVPGSSSGGQFITSGPNTGSYVSPPMMNTGRYSTPGMVNGGFIPAQPIPSNGAMTSPSPTMIGGEQLNPVPSMAPAQRMPTGDPF